MSVDAILGAIVLVFALWGALTGAARQLALALAAVAAWLASIPLGNWAGPVVSSQLKWPGRTGMVVSTLLGFALVFLIVRFLATVLIARLLDPDEKLLGWNRVFGFLLGAAKASAITYAVVCALVFIEDNVSVAGKSVGLTPTNSRVFTWARTWNVFEASHLSELKDLLEVATRMSAPQADQRLRGNLHYQALRKDPRIARLLNSNELKKARDSRDLRALLDNPDALSLLGDPVALRHIQRLTEVAP